MVVYLMEGAVCFYFIVVVSADVYALSLHDALPIWQLWCLPTLSKQWRWYVHRRCRESRRRSPGLRSEEHTSELQSQSNLVCRLLLENKNTSIEFASRGGAEFVDH